MNVLYRVRHLYRVRNKSVNTPMPGAYDNPFVG
jgi:hypothetical protein